MHLTYNHGIFIPKQAYLSIHKAKENQTCKRNSSIHLTCENTIIHLNKVASISPNNTYQKQDINTLETLIIHLSMFHHIIKIKPKHKCMEISNALLTLYLSLSNTIPMALMNGHVNEWHDIKMKENSTIACDSKKACEAEVQSRISMWTGFKKEQDKWNKPNKQHKESGIRFLGKHLHMQPRACICKVWPAYACSWHACVGLTQNPNLEKNKAENKALTKTLILTNKHTF